MTRILRNPKAMNASNPAEVKRVLIDIWALISEAPLTITADYTTTGRVALERLICTNTTAIVIKLDAGPADGDEVIVKQKNAAVTIDGNGNTIDGDATKVLSLYDGAHLVYADGDAEWSLF